jgi:CHAT domain-containing protein
VSGSGSVLKIIGGWQLSRPQGEGTGFPHPDRRSRARPNGAVCGIVWEMSGPISPDMVRDLVVQLSAGGYAVAGELRDAVARLESSDDRGAATELLGAAYLTLHTAEFGRADLDAAITTLAPTAHGGLSLSGRTNLSLALLRRFHLTGAADDATQARALLAEVAANTGPEDPKYALRTAAFLDADMACYESGLRTSLDESITHGQHASAGVAAGAPPAAYLAAELGNALRLRGLRDANAVDLDLAVDLLFQACDTTPEDDPNVARRLSNLAAALHDRFVVTGSIADVERAITVQLQAQQRARTDDERAAIANNLANFYLGRYMALGRTADLERSATTAPNEDHLLATHPNFAPSAALNAGLVKRALFNKTGDLNLLDEAIGHYRLALALGLPHPFDKARALDSLAVALADRYRHSGDLHLLGEAIECGRAAAEHMPDGHPERAGTLSNLANALRDLYLRRGWLIDLDEAAAAHRGALALLPAGHFDRPSLLNNAALVLTARFRRTGDTGDLEESIAHLAECVSVTPEDHSDLAARLTNLAAASLDRYRLTSSTADLDVAEVLLRKATTTPASPLVETAAEITLTDVLSERFTLSGETHFIDEVINSARRSLPSRDRPLDRPARLLRLAVALDTRGHSNDHVDAAQLYRAACIEAVDVRPDVTIVAARGWAWWALRRSTQDRHALKDVYDATQIGLRAVEQVADLHDTRAQQLTWRKDALGLAAARAHAFVTDGEPLEALAAFEDGRAVILRRLLPPSQLDAAKASEQSATQPSPIYVCLWSTPVGGAALLVGQNTVPHPVLLPGMRDHDVETWASHLRTAYRKGAAPFENLLAEMLRWQGGQVKPICEQLTQDTPIVLIPAGHLGALPWAASLVDTDDGPRHWLESADITVSPTLAVARWAADVAAIHDPVDFAAALSVANPRPSRLPDLRYARPEADAFTPANRILAERNATKTAVLAEIADASLIHLACHCISVPHDPLASRVLLAGDRPLYAEEFLAMPTLKARLAVLSGCDTAVVGPNHADEALGLATAFMGRGVPGVIATLWPVIDEESANLMGDVARNLKQGHPPQRALLDAQRVAAHPGGSTGGRISTWAGFSFIGA